MGMLNQAQREVIDERKRAIENLIASKKRQIKEYQEDVLKLEARLTALNGDD